MKYIGEPIEKNKYKQEDIYSREKGIYEYVAINPQNEDSRKNHNRFFVKLSIWNPDQHFGEFLGAVIAQKVGFKTCDVKLFRRQRPNTKYFDDGIISYVETSKYDDLFLPRGMIKRYRNEVNENPEAYWVLNVDTIMNAGFKEFRDNRRPEAEFLKFKQDIINMMVYDIKFTNADRDSENWKIRKNSKTGEIDLYPMFDNAAILGFERKIIIKNNNPKEYEKEIKEYDNERVSSIITPALEMQEEVDEDYKTVLKYLLKKYPEQTKKAVEAVNSFTVEDLKEILNNIEGISEERKKFTIDVFNERDKNVKEIYREYLDLEQER